MKKTVLSWSSGKDSAWSLYQLQQDPQIELMGLVTTINRVADRVAMHAVRRKLLEMQAQRAGLPIEIVPLPFPCSNADYEKSMQEFTNKAAQNGVEYLAFGDLFLEDVRNYRENTLKDSDLQPLFPIWGLDTAELAPNLVASGLQAYITCVDPRQLSPEFAGRAFDQAFLDDLPASVDPCGENGEFHTFAWSGPMFSAPIDVRVGETIERDGFVFTDLQSLSPSQ